MHVTENEDEHTGNKEIHFDCIIPEDVYPNCQIKWYYDEGIMGKARVEYDTLIFNKTDFCPAGFPSLVRCMAINSIMSLPVALDAHNGPMQGMIVFKNRFFKISDILVITGFVLTVLFCLSLVWALWFKEKSYTRIWKGTLADLELLQRIEPGTRVRFDRSRRRFTIEQHVKIVSESSKFSKI